MYNILKTVDLAQPQSMERDLTHAKYYIGPLLRGQAITIACALRRTLLAEIDGLAFVGISIPGLAGSEYGSIPGLEEDFLELALNLRQITVTCENRSNTGLARLKVSQRKKKSGLLTAQDLLLPPGYTVSNPHAYIARTTSANVDDFEIEFMIARGKGFVMADDLRPYLPDRFLPLEASFTPIERVSFSFETSRDNKTETLIFEIRTFGTVDPDIFLQEAAFILECTFRRLRERKPTPTTTHEVVNREEKSEERSAKPKPDQDEESSTSFTEEHLLDLDKISLRDLRLSVRARNSLVAAGFRTIGDVARLATVENLLGLKGLGKVSALEIEIKMLELFQFQFSYQSRPD